ncbi:MAG: orotate phosphoribosyltransferase [Alphaproteobacteria bacterium]|nr:orotate phosphoribosyltransferase [Alphaproteobacteria bacterium]MBV9692951.1 orotate phosphoribosyltransferase [Alphaproteobacteria bacterium]
MGWKDALIATYVAREAVRIGKFKLAGGGTSDLYFDGRRVSTYPKGLRAITDGMVATIREGDLLPAGCNLVAPVISGIPIASAISLALDVPFVMDRGKPKQHGLGQRFEGVFGTDPRCLIVDDLITVGSTLVQTVEALREMGKEVGHAIVVVDRNEGGRDLLAGLGVTLHALLTAGELRAAAARATS